MVDIEKVVLRKEGEKEKVNRLYEKEEKERKRKMNNIKKKNIKKGVFV